MKKKLTEIQRSNRFEKQMAISQKVGKVCIVVLLIMILAMVFLPVFFVINTSLKSYQDYMLNPIEVDVTKWRFQNYWDALNASNLLRSTLNSFIVTGTAVLCSILFTAMVSFAVGTLKYKGSKIVYIFALVSLFLAGEITMIPMYILYTKLGLIGNFGALILPAFLGVPGFGILVGASFVQTIPHEVHEAAIIDGVSAPQLFAFIDFPLMKPILALTAVMTFQGNWGSFLWPYVTVLSNKNAHTMALTLITQFDSQNYTLIGQYCAALVLMSLPIVIVYAFFSKYFIEGMTGGSVKG